MLRQRARAARRQTTRVLPSRAIGGLALALASLAAALLAGSARAHGDPAHDVLIVKDVFLPFGGAGISKETAQKLSGTVREANEVGYRIKVAMIPSKGDLGPVTPLWKKPQAYARFLGGELMSSYKRGRLLIVMPNGFGLFRGTPNDERLLSRIRLGPGGEQLTRRGTTAVQRLAASAGYELSAPKSSGGSSSSGRLAIALGGVAVLALISLATYLFFWRSRDKEERTA